MYKPSLMIASMSLLAACASNPDKLAPSYVSPVGYESYSCEQIGSELDRVNHRATDLHTSLKKEANADTAQMAVGLILFWPSLFFLEGGDGPEAAEYSRLKGERDALQKVSSQKSCTTQTANAGSSEWAQKMNLVKAQ